MAEERDMRIVRLEQRLPMEDLDLFDKAREQGWKLIAQGQGFFWQKGATESVTIFSDSALVDYIKEKFKETGEVAPPIQQSPTPIEDQAVPLSTSAQQHKEEAHEVDIRDGLLKELTDKGIEFQTNVGEEPFIAEVATDRAIYFFKCTLTPGNYEEIIEFIHEARAKINPMANAILLSCCVEDMDALRDASISSGFTAETWNYNVNSDTLQVLFLPTVGDGPVQAAQSGQLFSQEDAAATSVLKPQMHPSRLERHPALLMRAAGLNESHVADLEQTYREGGEVDPLDVFYDGTRYLVADGNHRHEGATRAGVLVDVNVHKGDLKAALIFALKSNAQHGLKLSDDDKRLKALTLLSDTEWFKQSDSHLATIARGITQQFISKVRRDLIKLKPFLVEDEHKLSDEDLAASFDVPTGLVRMIRRLPAEERESLTHNILSDDRRRVGADNVVRTVPAKEEERDTPLFEQTTNESSERKEAASETVTDEPPQAQSKPGKAESAGQPQTSNDENPEQPLQVSEPAPPEEETPTAPAASDNIPAASVEASQPNAVKQGDHYKAWLGATVKFTGTIFPDDGDEAGRKVLVVVHEDGGAPLTELARDKSASGPGVQALNNLFGKLRQELPARLASKTVISKPGVSAEVKPATPTTKKPATSSKKPAATKKPATSAQKPAASKKPKKAAKSTPPPQKKQQVETEKREAR